MNGQKTARIPSARACKKSITSTSTAPLMLNKTPQDAVFEPEKSTSDAIENDDREKTPDPTNIDFNDYIENDDEEASTEPLTAATFNNILKRQMDTLYGKIKRDFETSLLNSLKGEMERIAESKIAEKLPEMTEPLNLKVDEQKKEIVQLRKDHADMKASLTCALDKLSEIENSMFENESRSKQENIRICNARKGDESETTAWNHMKTILKTMKLNIPESEFGDSYFIGNCYGPDSSKRDIIIKVNNYRTKRTIMNKIGTSREALKKDGYYITNDYPAPVKLARRPLSQVVKAAHAVGVKSIKPKLNSIELDGKTYNLRDLSTMPKEVLHVYGSYDEKRDQKQCSFFGKKSPLSNHFPVKLNYENQTFWSSEQYLFMYEIAESKDEEGYARVNNLKDPGKIKQYSEERIANGGKKRQERWAQIRNEAIKNALACKFSHPGLKNYLLATKNLKLVESSIDDYWGSGVKLSDPKSLDENFPGSNELGKILMQIRENITNNIPLT